MAEATRMNVIVSGRVQGVGLRAHIRRQALDLGLAGQAENLDDGRVEVVAEGDRDDLELLLVRIRLGTSHSDVKDLEVTWGMASGLAGFNVY